MKKLYLLLLAIISAVSYAHAEDWYLAGNNSHLDNWADSSSGSNKLTEERDGVYSIEINPSEWTDISADVEFKFKHQSGWSGNLGYDPNNDDDKNPLEISDSNSNFDSIIVLKTDGNNFKLSKSTGYVKIYLIKYTDGTFRTFIAKKDTSLDDGYYLVGENYGNWKSTSDNKLTEASDGVYYIKNTLNGKFKIRQRQNGYLSIDAYGKADNALTIPFQSEQTTDCSPFVDVLTISNSDPTCLFFTPATKQVLLMRNDYYLRGTITADSTGNWEEQDQYKFTPNADKTYTLYVSSLSDEFLIARNNYNTKYGTATIDDSNKTYTLTNNSNASNISCGNNTYTNVTLTFKTDSDQSGSATLTLSSSTDTDNNTGSHTCTINFTTDKEGLTGNYDCTQTADGSNIFTYTVDSWKGDTNVQFTIDNTIYGSSSDKYTELSIGVATELKLGDSKYFYLIGEKCNGNKIRFTVDLSGDTYTVKAEIVTEEETVTDPECYIVFSNASTGEYECEHTAGTKIYTYTVDKWISGTNLQVKVGDKTYGANSNNTYNELYPDANTSMKENGNLFYLTCDNKKVTFTIDISGDTYKILAKVVSTETSEGSGTDTPVTGTHSIDPAIELYGTGSGSTALTPDDNGNYTVTMQNWQQGNTFSFYIDQKVYGSDSHNTSVVVKYGSGVAVTSNDTPDTYRLDDSAVGKDVTLTLAKNDDGTYTLTAEYAESEVGDGWYIVGKHFGWAPSSSNKLATMTYNNNTYYYTNVVNMTTDEFKIAHVSGTQTTYYGYEPVNVSINNYYTLKDNAADMKIQSSSLAGVRGDLRIYVSVESATEGQLVKLAAMRNYIAVRGNLNNNTRDANVLYDYRLTPEPNLTYDISLDAINGEFKLCASDGSENNYEYGASGDDIYVTAGQTKATVSQGGYFKTAASYRSVKLTLFADSSDERYSKILLSGNGSSVTGKYFFGTFDGNTASDWENDGDNVGRVYFTTGTESGIYNCHFVVSKTTYFNMCIDGTIYRSTESVGNFVISDGQTAYWNTNAGQGYTWEIPAGIWDVVINRTNHSLTFTKGTSITLNMKINNKDNNTFVSSLFDKGETVTDDNNEEITTYILYLDNTEQLYGTISVDGTTWRETKKGSKGFRTVRPNVEYTQMTTGSDQAELFIAPGSYMIEVKLDKNKNITSLKANGTAKYPNEVWIFGDILDSAGNRFPTCEKDYKTRGGNPFVGNGIRATDVQIADEVAANSTENTDDYISKFEGLEALSGYYIARKVTFTPHTYSWNKYDNYNCVEDDSFNADEVYAKTHCIFGLAESLITPTDDDYSNGNLIWDNRTYERLGTRLGSDYAAAVEYTNDENLQLAYNSYPIIPTNVSNDTKLVWENGGLKDFNYLPMSVTSVEALCYAVPYNWNPNTSTKSARYDTDSSTSTELNASGYGANQYDVLIDLVNQRIALTNGSIATSVKGIEEAFGDNLVNVYNMQGIMVRHDVKQNEATADLPTGIYIVGHKKVYVRH
jgi:hypothetical protein